MPFDLSVLEYVLLGRAPYLGLLETPSPVLFQTGILSSLPDGTARFPWNGFAGEGISVTRVQPPASPYPNWVATFPGGSRAARRRHRGARPGAQPGPRRDGRA